MTRTLYCRAPLQQNLNASVESSKPANVDEPPKVSMAMKAYMERANKHGGTLFKTVF